MTDGISSAAIIQQIMAKEWAKSERYAYVLLQQAREQWMRFEESSRDDKRRMKVQELKKHLRDMDDAHRGSPAGMRTILAYEKEIIKLEGLYDTHDKNGAAAVAAS